MGKNKKQQHKKLTNDDLLEKLNYKFTRDAEWFKRTVDTINKTKDELDKKMFGEEKKKQKIEFINKLNAKLKDYKDAIKFEERYKKVRFFERRKLERMLKKFDKEIAIENDETKLEELKKRKEQVITDINYVKVLLL